MEELFTTLNVYFQEQILPLIDALYIAVVILGAYVFLGVFKNVVWVKNNKAQFVFLFASVASFLYVGLDAIVGNLVDMKVALFRNFINYCLAISIYHTVIKTVMALWKSTIAKFTK